MERVLGTVTGGLLGYGLAILNDRLPLLEQPFFTVIAATVVAFMSIIMGYKLRLDYSGRLFIMTFILVVMAAPKTSGKLHSKPTYCPHAKQPFKYSEESRVIAVPSAVSTEASNRADASGLPISYAMFPQSDRNGCSAVTVMESL